MGDQSIVGGHSPSIYFYLRSLDDTRTKVVRYLKKNYIASLTQSLVNTKSFQKIELYYGDI